MKKRISKQAIVLILIGNLCTALPYLFNKFIAVPEDLKDFLTGFGVAVMIMAVVTDKKARYITGARS
jgi:hypothetical protein